MNDRQFRQRLKESFPSLRLVLWGEDLVVKQGDKFWFEILPEGGGGALVQGPHVHAHRKNVQEAFDLIWDLLRGQSRAVEEHRDGTLAATWIETRDGSSFIQSDLAAHLSPWDEVEWIPRDGEVWRTRRFTYERVGDDAEQRFFDLASNEPQGSRPELWGWLASTLGAPEPGFRWTQGPDSRSVLQVPKDWRRRQPVEDGFVDFESPDEDLFLRIAAYYRDPSEPASSQKSSQHSRSQTEESDQLGDWNCDRHALTFQGADCDMLAVLEVFWPREQPEPKELRSAIRAIIPLTRMTPATWTGDSSL